MTKPLPNARSLHHKLLPPGVERGQVWRTPLIERLLGDDAAQCVVLQAPAGHGKTMLLRQLKEASVRAGIRTAWLKIDETDNDLYRLLNHLDHMVSGLEETLSSEQGNAREHSLPKGWAERFNNRLSEVNQEIHLFLDDFQRIDEVDIEKLFHRVIDQLPPKVRIFISSRSLPRIGLSQLQVQGRLDLLRYDELKFSEQEARAFFTDHADLSLDNDELSIIYNRSEGWPAALQLFRLTLAKRPIKDSLNNLESYTPFQITEYLTNNVLQQQSLDAEEFILQCALLPRLCAPLCEFVTGRADSQEMLLDLEHRGLFLNNIDGEGIWFQFHGLFANYLANILVKRSPRSLRQVHQNAATWFLQEEMFEDALYHAIEAKNYDVASKAMDIWATEQITSACLLSVERWADKIPQKEIFNYPTLVVKITWALTFLRRRKKVLPYLQYLKNLDAAALDEQFKIERQITLGVVEMALDNLDQAFKNVENIDTEIHEAADFWAFELGAAANIQAFQRIAQGNFAAARYHIAIGRNHTHGGSVPFLAGYNTGLTIISSYLQGRVEEAGQRSLSALKAKGLEIEESYAAVATVCCSLYPLYERNDLDTVVRVFRQYEQEINTGLLLDFMSIAYLATIRTYDALGNTTEAQQLLDTLEALGIGANWPRLKLLCGWENVRRSLLAGDLVSAKTGAEALENRSAEQVPLTYLTFSDAIENPDLGDLRLQVYLGTADDIDARLNEAITDASAHNRVPREIKLRLLNALHKTKTGTKERASRELKIALSLAADYGFHRTVIDEGPEIINLIQTHLNGAWSGALNRYAHGLLTQPGGEQHSTEDGEPLTEALTAREMQMLALLAKGETNKSIAKNLFVSENTVKFHLKNIFQKMGVKTRTQAISCAISTGLV